MNAQRAPFQQRYQPFGHPLYRPQSNEIHVLVREAEKLLDLCRHLRDDGFYLVSVVANDERELEDHGFKLYYLFSHPTLDLFFIVENPLEPGSETYTSIHHCFPGVDPFEREAADLLGLYPREPQGRVVGGGWLHASYPSDLYPLRRDATRERLRDVLATHALGQKEPVARHPPAGEWLLPVGPVHAGVIEPGHFSFQASGEVIEALTIQLGYTHKGIERLFQTAHTLSDGWRLAELVSGDASFAHSLAYCRAVESLAGVRVPPEADWLRGLFLELERLANHVGDCAALAHDVALDIIASEMSVLRERLLRLHQRLSGHRLLRGLNRPGGLVLPAPLDPPVVSDAQITIESVTTQFFALAHYLAEMPGFRQRAVDLGVLTIQQALELGATGLVARASGLKRDVRLHHPQGIYQSPQVRALLETPRPGLDDRVLLQETTGGDVLARFLTRLCEAQTSSAIMLHLLAHWPEDCQASRFVAPLDLVEVPNFEFSIGYAESWRGDVVYWLMKDKFERIYRCKVRDPSLLNWPALKAAVEPHDEGARHWEIILPDFPLVNKSFNLSYSGNDL